MPVIFKRNIEDHAVTGLWDIKENTQELLQLVRLNETERQIFASFKTEPRMNQWLAWRALLGELMKPYRHHVEYDEAGKPYLAGSDNHISVTHTEHLAAVILGNHIRVGIDIERISPRIEKVKDRFLSREELAQISPERALELLTTGWCAKEALYKLYGLRNLDFRENIQLDFPSGADIHNFTGKIMHPMHSGEYHMIRILTDDFMIVYAMDNQ